MRISSAYAFESSLSNLQRRQGELTDAQTRLTSGKRVQRASDDPASAAVAERALARLARAESQARAADASRNAMQLTESALGDSGELLQQARELLVRAGNSTLSDSDRAVISQNLKGLRDDLLAVANRDDGSGRYLFGGPTSGQAPLAEAGGVVGYAGTSGQATASGGATTPLSVDGEQVFLLAEDPANPGTTYSLFDTLDAAISGLALGGQTAAQVAQTTSTAIGRLDIGAANLSSWRSRAGEALNRLDALDARLSQTQLDAKSARSNAEDLDMVQAISDFQNRQTGYDAALKTYSLVQRMSLFDYLK